MTLRTTLPFAIALTAVFSFAASDKPAPEATGSLIIYTATGTFASPATSGADTLKLAGEPFSVTIPAPAVSQPYEHGPNWAAFNKLKLNGTVHSGLLGATPVTITSTQATIIQAFDPEVYDSFTMEAPIKVVGISLDIDAVIIMPFGTFPNPLLHPFPTPITLAPANATMSYADGTATTVLAIASGTLTATLQGGTQ
ncbi:MAG: hypothetical protein ABSF64_32930 [Bryobacteraceae bacterium]|jgi:hypothetical protein